VGDCKGDKSEKRIKERKKGNEKERNVKRLNINAIGNLRIALKSWRILSDIFCRF
jgi:hypothetical protein